MLQKNSDPLCLNLREAVRRELCDAPGCHDFDHTERVLRNAEMLAGLELKAEDSRSFLAVSLAALLHDIARPEEMKSNGKICHAQAGYGKAIRFLRECGCCDEELIQLVANAVKRHRYRGKDQPENLIDKILYDADKLDSIGAVGVGRAFHFAGRIGARLHNPAEEAVAGEAYGREDSAYREYLVKLRSVPERMLTVSGRAAAAERAEFMHEFFRRLCEESGVK